MQSLQEANRMLDVFTSVGARKFDVTFLNIDGEKRGFRKAQSAAQIRNSLPRLLPGLTERQNSIVIRPHGDGVTLVQLDDLDADALKRVESIAFLTLATSPRNHQAWVAVSGADKDIARRLRKGTGSDLSASGATRLASTMNYKRKYEPNFPTVSILSTVCGRIVTPEQLEQAGLLAPPEPVRVSPLRVSSSRNWPDYQKCVEGAPMNHSGTAPDVSRADFFYAKMAADRGHGIEEIAARLMELSTKAKENGERYARTTAENATAASENQQKRAR
jgi:RepB DNA-primase from phage plasmid